MKISVVTPLESGRPLLVRNTMDSRFRGNDVIFGGAVDDEESRCDLKTYQGETPRFARNDKGTGFPQAANVVLPKKVKQQRVCNPERSEGSLELFSP
jgi:hypothetical protein